MKERALRKAELKGDLADDLAFDNLRLARRVAELERRLERAAAGGGLASLIGLAPAPDNAMARDFTRHAGSLNRRLAVAADQVTLLLAGCPVDLKPRPRCGR